jgi:hypothetical protein
MTHGFFFIIPLDMMFVNRGDVENPHKNNRISQKSIEIRPLLCYTEINPSDTQEVLS